MLPEILGGLGLAGLVIIAGALIYRAGRGAVPDIEIRLVPGSGNISEVNCAEACLQFNNRRAEQCTAKFREAAGRATMEAARTEYLATVALMTAMIAAAVATGLSLPWPANLIVSLVFWTMATVLTGLSIYKLGKLDEASAAWDKVSLDLEIANSRVVEARGIVSANCSPEAAASCFSSHAPC